MYYISIIRFTFTKDIDLNFKLSQTGQSFKSFYIR